MTRRAAAVAVLVAALAVAPGARANVTVVSGGVRGGATSGFAWDPTHAGTVWAGVDGAGLYKSTNGGAAWTEVPLPGFAEHVPNRVLASKSAADLIFVCERATAATSSIWRSGNAGASFAGVLSGSGGNCNAIVDGTTTGTLWAGIGYQQAHVYKSVDAGVTWTPTSLNVAGETVTDLVQIASGRLVVATDAHVYYSDNGGGQFTMATLAADVFGLAYNGANQLMTLAATGGSSVAIYTSPDGATWTAGALAVSPVGLFGRISYHAASDTFFVSPTDGRLLQSSNAAGGYSFAAATDRAASALAPVALALDKPSWFSVDPADATHLFLGDSPEGVLASADGGGVWVVSNDGMHAGYADRAIKTPGGHRYAAGRNGFVHFSASSLTAPWIRIFRPNAAGEPVRALAVDSADDKRVAIAQSDPTGGNTALLLLPDATGAGEDAPPFAHSAWQTLTYPDAAKSPIEALLVDGMTIFAGVVRSKNAASGQYLYVSTNGGTSWTPTSLVTTGGVRALAFDPSNRQTIYAGAGDYADNSFAIVFNGSGLWKSTDGGAHFARISTGSAALDAEAARTIVVDPSNGQRVWVFADRLHSTSGSDGDIFESLDGGATWTTITPSGGVISFAYSPAEDLLVAGTAAAGTNVFVKAPGDGSTVWSPAFGVGGQPLGLYAGSIGVAAPTGVYEASGVMIAPSGDLGLDQDAGVDGMLPGDVVDAGGGGKMPSGGCGCAVVPATGAAAWGLALALVFARLLFRRRAGRARPRA